MSSDERGHRAKALKSTISLASAGFEAVADEARSQH